MAEEENSSKSVYLFGRDISQIPCFRDSFLYGIGGGLGIGTLAFLGTSRTRLALNIGFGTFFCGTIAFWFTCRYRWSQKKFEYSRLQEAARKQTLFEGTELEREINKNK